MARAAGGAGLRDDRAASTIRVVRLAVATSLVLCSCRLVAPFDLDALPPAVADGGDGGPARDAEADLDEPGLADADSEVDSGPWDSLAGCDGPVSAERWALAALVDGALRGYLSGRDCTAPVELCEGCFPTAISPSGEAVLVSTPGDSHWRLDDELDLVRLGPGGPARERLGIRGASPAWADDGSFYYLAAPPSSRVCSGAEPPELTELRRFDLALALSAVVGAPLRRAWVAGGPFPSTTRPLVAVGQDLAPRCDINELVTSIRDVATGGDTLVQWTYESAEYELPVGALPGGAGFIVERFDYPVRGISSLYAVSWAGESRRVGPEVPGAISVSLIGSIGVSFWAPCASVRQMGPGCELYCRDAWGPGWWRVPLAGGDPELVPCPGPWEEVRIMDVHQS